MTGPTDLSSRIGSVTLDNPVMTAAGTSGHGTELGDYFDLSSIGAVVVKSLSVDAWPGNPAPRVCPVPGGMLNSVGLQGPGLAAWAEDHLPLLLGRGARVVVSIWGRRAEDYHVAGAVLASVLPPRPPHSRLPGVVAVEVNVSCPNLDDRSRMFAHSPESTAAAVRAACSAGLPVWAKLSPNTDAVIDVAGAALDAGAEAVTLVNTLIGLAIDETHRRPSLAAAGGGLSGAALHSVALRAVYDCRATYPDAAIVGVGGIADGAGALRMLLAGADAVQVGTATLADPRAPRRVLDELRSLLEREEVRSVAEIVAAAQNGGRPDRRGGPERRAPRFEAPEPAACTMTAPAPGATPAGTPTTPGTGTPATPGTTTTTTPAAAAVTTAAGAAAPASPAGDSRRRLGLALDFPDLPVALEIAQLLAPWFGVAKVGPELFISAGPDALRELRRAGFEVFLDLKLHDIPTTVRRGAAQAAALGATYLTVHASGGAAMVAAAVEGFTSGRERGGAGEHAGVLAVTVLTSEVDAPPDLLRARAALAAASGCVGLVCAAGDLAVVREAAPDLLAVVPGIRLPSASVDDQSRVATPREAAAAGAGLLVLGRTVTAAEDPVSAARQVVKAVGEALAARRP